ncbi:hypothetical protein PFNF54_04081 [Plasmodium falciparum NF54]|nr:hypothetical protein PFNF54_04081 [Plasmodium falciparum NF54]
MKEVMDNFNRQTQQRFHEYDECMVEKRMQCKEQCDKEIQKIILKDKMEKELMDKFATLQTDIQNDAIPTCICEKSLADKTEKFCLNCGVNVGGGITLSSGVLGGIGSVAVNAWKTTEIAAATKAAIDKGLALGKIAGDIEGAAKVVELVKSTFKIEELGVRTLESIIDANTYTKSSLISGFIETEYSRLGCGNIFTGMKKPFCNSVYERIFDTSGGKGVYPITFIEKKVETMVSEAESVAAAKSAKVAAAEKAAILETSKKAIETTSYNWYTTIGYSITAILIIVLIMVIIYLILRYRRKKKMKKKLQYIKLLKE